MKSLITASSSKTGIIMEQEVTCSFGVSIDVRSPLVKQLDGQAEYFVPIDEESDGIAACREHER